VSETVVTITGLTPVAATGSGQKITVYPAAQATQAAVAAVVAGVSNFTNIIYDNNWPLVDSLRRKSPTITHSQTTKTRVDFTAAVSNTVLVIHLEVSSESSYDFAFVGNLDSTAATRTSNYDSISGTTSKTISIPIPTAGSHFIEIGYGKDGSETVGSDCAWFWIEF
jgi:hypothetical protein